MEENFTVQLFDLLVYLIPGLIIVISLILLFEGKIPEDLKKKPTGNVIYILIFSFFLGLIIHQASGAGYFFCAKILKFDIFQYQGEKFGEIERVKKLVRKKIKTESLAYYHTYNYAKTFVIENSKYQNATVKRLIALYLCCRNSMLAIFILWICFLLFNKRKSGLKKRFVLYSSGILIITEILLAIGFFVYWTACIYTVFTSFIAIYS